MAGLIMDASVVTYEGVSSLQSENYLDYSEPAWILGKHFVLEDGIKLKLYAHYSLPFYQ